MAEKPAPASDATRKPAADVKPELIDGVEVRTEQLREALRAQREQASADSAPEAPKSS